MRDNNLCEGLWYGWWDEHRPARDQEDDGEQRRGATLLIIPDTKSLWVIQVQSVSIHSPLMFFSSGSCRQSLFLSSLSWDVGLRSWYPAPGVVGLRLWPDASRVGGLQSNTAPVIGSFGSLHMVMQLRTTRAKTCNAANAILDGADCIILHHTSSMPRRNTELQCLSLSSWSYVPIAPRQC